MKRVLSCFLVLTLLASTALAADLPGEVGLAASETGAEYDGFLVELDESVPNNEEIVQDTDGCEVIADGVAVAEEPQNLRELLDEGVVEYCEPNYLLSVQDTYTPTQWNLLAIDAQEAWYHENADSGYDMRGDGVTIAIIDSGVYASHSDLNSSNILTEENLSGASNGIDTFHGTFVAGIIAAQLGDSSGLAGVDGIAPDVTILPICITSNGNTTSDLVIQAINYAVEQGADVINMSLGGTSASSLMKAACDEAAAKGVILVASAGNYSSGDTHSSSNYMYPASFDSVISVSACEQSGSSAAFDDDYSYFNDKVTVAAPGTAIVSLGIASTTTKMQGSGTSFAAPVVTAMAAIAKEEDSSIDCETFKALLEATSTDLGDPGYDDYYGNGLVNVGAMVSAFNDQLYTITYKSGGDAAAFNEGTTASSTYAYSSETLSLPTPVLADHYFLGWYENADFSGSPVTTIPPRSSGNKTFYAKWESTTEATASSVTVLGYAATQAGTAYSVTVPADETVDMSDIVVTPTASTASVSTPTGSGGSWSFTITSTSGKQQKAYALAVTFSGHVPTVDASAATAGTATPASLDGKTEAKVYTASTSGWFTDSDDDLSSVKIQACDGARRAFLSEGTLTYTPAAEDAAKTVSIVLRATDSNGFYADLTKTVTVAALPESNSTLNGVSALSANLSTMASTLELPLHLYGNTVKSVSLTSSDGTETIIPTSGYLVVDTSVSASEEISFLKTYLKTLSVGSYTITIAFSAGTNVTCALTLTSTTGTTGGTSMGGGGGGGGATATTAASATVTNTDGSKTTTTTAANGTVTAVTTKTDGSTVTTVTATDGTVSEKQSLSDGTTVTASIAENGTASLSAAVPASTDQEATWSTGSLTLDTCCGTTEIPASVAASGVAVTLEVGNSAQTGLPVVTLHAVSGGKDVTQKLTFCIAVSIADNSSTISAAGSTWVRNLAASALRTTLVASSGGKIFASAYVSGGYLTVTGFAGGTLTLLDNEKSFEDVPASYWGAEAVRFVAARELLCGTSATSFSPEQPVTRQMLWTVLARLDGETVSGADAYDQAQAWAVSNGVSDGSEPAQTITREQLAVMLWRMAGSPGSSQSLSAYSDADEISDYAAQAVQWAVASGILKGSDGSLTPDAFATRAQVAVMLERRILGETG